MHRKDYKLIGNVLRSARKEAKITEELCCIDKIINDFCLALKQENSSFNEKRFRSYIEKGE